MLAQAETTLTTRGPRIRVAITLVGAYFYFLCLPPASAASIPIEPQPRALVQVQPIYPDSARSAGIEGVVLVQALVGKDGRVRDTRVVRSIHGLDAAAVVAVEQWVFEPALANSKPVSVWVEVPVHFGPERRGLSPTTQIASNEDSRSVASYSVTALADTLAPADGLAPVWQLDVTEVDGATEAKVVFNEFANPAYPAKFPTPHLMVRRFTDHSTVVHGRISPKFSAELAVLGVDVDGRRSPESLQFVNSSHASVNPSTSNVAMLTPSSADGSMVPFSDQWTSRAVVLRTPLAEGESLLEWEQSPDRRWHVVHSELRTLVMSTEQDSPLLELPTRSYYGVFSLDGRRYAAVTEHGMAHKWFVVGSDGKLIMEGSPFGGEISQLQLSSDGHTLTFNRDARTIAVNLATGQEAVLSVPDGVRYYSADGRTMLVLSANPGALHLFDVGDPRAPMSLGTARQGNGSTYITGAVSADGSIVAAQMLEPSNNPTQSLTRVLAFDRSMNQKAIVTTQTDELGLQFEGAFLFVGVQRHPIPVWLGVRSTKRIQLFDLSGLRGR